MMNFLFFTAFLYNIFSLLSSYKNIIETYQILKYSDILLETK